MAPKECVRMTLQTFLPASFWKTVTLIGRNRDVVDYFLGCATPRGNDYISRIHARVIRTSTYDLVDSSLTGVYVNDLRICGEWGFSQKVGRTIGLETIGDH